jgi:hypothetical protein
MYDVPDRSTFSSHFYDSKRKTSNETFYIFNTWFIDKCKSAFINHFYFKLQT